MLKRYTEITMVLAQFETKKQALERERKKFRTHVDTSISRFRQIQDDLNTRREQEAEGVANERIQRINFERQKFREAIAPTMDAEVERINSERDRVDGERSKFRDLIRPSIDRTLADVKAAQNEAEKRMAERGKFREMIRPSLDSLGTSEVQAAAAERVETPTRPNLDRLLSERRQKRRGLRTFFTEPEIDSFGPAFLDRFSTEEIEQAGSGTELIQRFQGESPVEDERGFSFKRLAEGLTAPNAPLAQGVGTALRGVVGAPPINEFGQREGINAVSPETEQFVEQGTDVIAGSLQTAFSSAIPPAFWDEVEKIPIAGDTLRRQGEFWTSPGGIAILLGSIAVQGVGQTAAELAGETALGALGRLLETEAGAPSGTRPVFEAIGGVGAGVGGARGVRQAARGLIPEVDIPAARRALDDLVSVNNAPDTPVVARAAGEGASQADNTFIGQRVVSPDRGNVGTVVSLSDDGQTASVRFVNSETGLEATKPFPTSDLAPVGAGGGKRLSPDTSAIADFAEGSRFVSPLRPLDEVASEVVTTGTGGKLDDALKIVTARTGINPSLTRADPIGRNVTAYWRQRTASEELSEVAVQAALDSHGSPGLGRSPFSIGSDARVSGVGKPWMDVFSRPDSHPLNTFQRDFVDDFLQVVSEVEDMRVSAGLKPRSLKEATEDAFYVPRQVKGVRGVDLQYPSRASLRRHYEVAEEGIANGVKYSDSPRETLKLHVQAAYREIADAQLADELAEFSVTPTAVAIDRAPAKYQALQESIINRRTTVRQVRDEIAAARRDLARPAGTPRQVANRKADLAKLEGLRAGAGARVDAVRAQFGRARNVWKREMEAARKSEFGPESLFGGDPGRNIPIAQWRNRFFPSDQAQLLSDELATFGKGPVGTNWATNAIEKIGNYTRFLAAAGDFAAPFIQGLPVLTRNPVVWSRATFRHYQAFFDPAVQARLIRDNLDTYKDMARNGVPIGDVEFFTAIRPGGGVSIPGPEALKRAGGEVGRQTYGRFGASYSTFLAEARRGMWEALGPKWAEKADLGAYIRNLTGALDTRALGVRPNQRAVESMWLAFSPRLLRSTLAMVADLRNPLSKRGAEAWRTVAQLATGVTGIYIATGIALGKSDAEITQGLNPLGGKRFLSYEIDGDWIGVGGQFRALIQLGAGAVSAGAPGGRPASDLWSTNFRDNPFVQAYQSRGAPALNIVGGFIETLSGGSINALPYDNVTDIPDLALHMMESALPFSVQGLVEGERPLTAGTSFVGARTSAQTSVERLEDAFNAKFGEGAWTGQSADYRIARANPELLPLVEVIERQGVSQGRSGALEQQELQQTLLGLEKSNDLPRLSQAVIAEQSGAGPQFAEAYETYQTQSSGVFERSFFGREVREPKGARQKSYVEWRDAGLVPSQSDPEVLVLPRNADLTIDWDSYFRDKDAAWDKLAPELQKAIEGDLRLEDANGRIVESQYNSARDIRSELFEIPRWRGIDLDRQEIFEDITRVAGDSLKSGKFAFAEAVSQLGHSAQDGFLAWKLSGRTGDLKANPDRRDFLTRNAALLKVFFPELYSKTLNRQLAGVQ